MSVDGTYGLVYEGDIGVGIGVLVVKDGVIRGIDSGGGTYEGTVIEKSAGGDLMVNLKMRVAAGAPLVQGTSPQPIPYTKDILVTTPPKFGDGQPVELPIAPGVVTVMIKRMPDDFAAFLSGFVVTHKAPEG